MISLELEKDIKNFLKGLSLVKKILNFYNAKIWVENRISDDYTKGTKFILTFPMVKY